MKSQKILFNLLGEFTVQQFEDQNRAYEGAIIEIIKDKQLIRSRLAQKTPKKEGYFVVFWEKDELNVNQPFKANNSPDYLAIVVDDGNQKGLFLIPKQIAVQQKILSTDRQTGKMAMRFYPPWCTNLNNTAKKTKRWQMNYFKAYQTHKS